MSHAEEHHRGWGRGTSFVAVSVAAVATGLLLSTAQAHAAYDPLGTGTVKLTLDKDFARFLAQNQVTISAGAPAK